MVRGGVLTNQDSANARRGQIECRMLSGMTRAATYLETCRQGGAESRPGAHTDASLVHCRRVRYARKLCVTLSQAVLPSGMNNDTHLQLTRPKVCGRVIDQRAGKVALHSADQVVILRVRPLPDKHTTAPVSDSSSMGDMPPKTYDTMPKAWYSIIDDRDIREMRPCCMPRSKRRIATLGDGCGARAKLSGWGVLYYLWNKSLTTSMSTLTSLTVNHGIRML